MSPPVRCGQIALAGAPNVGKSTLLNTLVREHLAIVSPRAQCTRLPVTGLLTTADTQYIFHDLPGFLDPAYPLQARMRTAGLAALKDVDLILHLHPAPEAPAPPFATVAGLPSPPRAPVLTVYTMADRAFRPDDLLTPSGVAGALPVSAVTGLGIPELLEAIRRQLPEGEFRFPADEVGTQPVRFFASEYLREAAFMMLHEEVPYALAVEIEEFRDHTRPVFVRATLLVERDSQKGIVIGRGGETIREIGRHARTRLEALLGEQVYLDCRVKVLPGWRRSSEALDRLGFPPQPGRK